jgi:hypothetical protein
MKLSLYILKNKIHKNVIQSTFRRRIQMETTVEHNIRQFKNRYRAQNENKMRYNK